MSKDSGSNEKISLLFAILVVLSGLWYYTWSLTLKTTYTSPESKYLWPLGISNVMLAFSILVSLLLIYLYGVEYIQDLRYGRYLNLANLEKSFFQFWPVALIIILISGILIVFKEISNFNRIIISLIIIITTVTAYVYVPISNIKKLSWKVTTIGSAIIMILYFLGLLAISSGVVIKTDEEFYKNKDVMQVSIRPEGFIYPPKITKVWILGKEEPLDKNRANFDRLINLSTYNLSKQEHTINVTFEQKIIIPISFEKYTLLNIANQ